MLKLQSNIHIDNYKYNFDFVCEVQIKSSFEDLTDTCKIVLPRRLTWKGKAITSNDDSPLRKGMSINVALGYGDRLDQVFAGYIVSISPKTPIELVCEDAMWKLKQINIKEKSYKSITIKDLLSDIVPPEIPFKTIDEDLGPMRISNLTVAKVLEELKQKTGLRSFMREGVLCVGLPYEPSQSNKEVFRFNETIISDDDLVFQHEEDLKIKVKAISIMPDNSRVEDEAGEEGGDVRTLHFYNKPKSALKALAERELEKIRYTGFTGKFTTFGQPVVRHGDVAILEDTEIQDRNGSYLIKSVERNFGMGGSRQIIELDKRLSQNGLITSTI